MLRLADSVRAVRWLKRAESLARSIKLNYGTRRELLDGYIVEGRKAGKNRKAIVMDTPGRFAHFGALSKSNMPVSSFGAIARTPTRRLFLDDTLVDHPEPLQFATEPGTSPPLYAFMLGPAPTEGIKPLGVTQPLTTPSGVLQTMLTHPIPDPTVVVGTTMTDLRQVSQLWIWVRLFGAGGAGDTDYVIHESVFRNRFGGTLLPRVEMPVNGASNIGQSCIAAYVDGVLTVATIMHEDEIGWPTKLCFVAFARDPETGAHYIKRAGQVRSSEFDNPLFTPHPVLHLGRAAEEDPDGESLGGLPFDPPYVTQTSYPCFSMACNGQQLRFMSTITATLSARSLLYPNKLETWWGSVVVSGRLQVTFDLASGAVSHTIDMVDCSSPRATAAMEGDVYLYTSLDWRVGEWLTGPWEAVEYVNYVSVAADGPDFYSVTGVHLGVRGWASDPPNFIWQPDLGANYHKYASTCTRIVYEGPHGSALFEGDQYAFESGVVLGGSVFGGTIYGLGDQFPIVPIGQGRVETPLYRVGGSARALLRIEPSGISQVALPDGAALPISSCYTTATVDPDTGEQYPHRSVVAYAPGGASTFTIEVRVGDDTIATAVGLSRDMRMGVYYLGPPGADLAYGTMGRK